MIDALDIRVRGIVQGVGFRPFVYRLARRYLVNGWVLNDREGVLIHAEAESKLLDEFVTELHMNPPAAARITEVELKEVPMLECTHFEIRESEQRAKQETTLVSGDLATCADCAQELFDPTNRRYRYPFINCTNCGPRFTIIDRLPYDRPATSMAPFTMCPDCAREYADPADRRFHAQPDACWECGPRISWCVTACDANSAGEVIWGTDREASDAIFAEAVKLLSDGGIVAVKGLGGFHLACDAFNSQAVARLRTRKRRDGKAFAVMVPTVESARKYCCVDDVEAALLESAARPIVLLRKRRDAQLACGLADELPELGVMLPATPVQLLLMHDYLEETGKDMLVMTSGNVHDEPIVTDDGDAYGKLADIADAILGNNRPILSRYDDSVVRVLKLGGTNKYGEPNEAVQFVRRARGYAPVPLALPEVEEATRTDCTVFAAGSEQKATFTFFSGGKAFVSQHVGDLEDMDTFDAWLDAKARFERLFSVSAVRYACDAHPEYLSAKWVRDQVRNSGAECVEVQHHHAHIASVLGEHGIYGPVCGIAFDGTGYGADGAIWGGEVLLANQIDFERFANFAYVPMPGGAAAIRNPLRMAYGVLWAYDLLEHPAAVAALNALGDQANLCDQMIERGLNTPMTSSVGRLFDAASALLGVCVQPTYEGEAAILLEAALWQGADTVCDEGLRCVDPETRARYAVTITKNVAAQGSTAHDTSVVLLDAQPTFAALLDDMAAGIPVPEIALRFHDAFANAIVEIAQLVHMLYGISIVALSGGVFMNRFLVEHAVSSLGEAGFTVALNGDLPPNDGCISYGQAVVASAR
ncbi:MAG: carbamoyltransferase HypF [Eggerthellaceae bacterium]|nr:carbamoyltransferase HypF [Eggerthellaceae bacterium]